MATASLFPQATGNNYTEELILPSNMILLPVVEEARARSNLITKALPQFCLNFILDRYPYDMEAQENIANTAIGQMETRSCLAMNQ